jgi:hypothetical protein
MTHMWQFHLKLWPLVIAGLAGVQSGAAQSSEGQSGLAGSCPQLRPSRRQKAGKSRECGGGNTSECRGADPLGGGGGHAR